MGGGTTTHRPPAARLRIWSITSPPAAQSLQTASSCGQRRNPAASISGGTGPLLCTQASQLATARARGSCSAAISAVAPPKLCPTNATRPASTAPSSGPGAAALPAERWISASRLQLISAARRQSCDWRHLCSKSKSRSKLQKSDFRSSDRRRLGTRRKQAVRLQALPGTGGGADARPGGLFELRGVRGHVLLIVHVDALLGGQCLRRLRTDSKERRDIRERKNCSGNASERQLPHTIYISSVPSSSPSRAADPSLCVGQATCCTTRGRAALQGDSQRSCMGVANVHVWVGCCLGYGQKSAALTPLSELTT